MHAVFLTNFMIFREILSIFTYMMDPNKTGPTRHAIKVEVSGWKCTENRKSMKRSIEEFIITRAPLSWTYDLLELRKYIEMFEEKIFASAKDENEYIANISARIKTAYSQSAEPNPLRSNSSGSEREANVECQEQLYQQAISNIVLHFLSWLFLCLRDVPG
ncbi:PREDICTED: uncharacterized protein LOC109344851 [Lupinus angustifolius]|uniref:uncharacterized protein LOC109344851 n=1 Tax=Lupinus angustifolius TaxID=3871 RepID=UPI00092F6EF8|nr:PREDICTED: uncharacterized protein LOC109344851 [Lupinus angustifolius]